MIRLLACGVLVSVLIGLPSTRLDGFASEAPLNLQLMVRGLTLNKPYPRAKIPVVLLIRTRVRQLSMESHREQRPKLSIEASLVHGSHGEVFWSKHYEAEFSSLGQVRDQLGLLLGEAFEVADPGDFDWHQLIQGQGLLDI